MKTLTGFASLCALLITLGYAATNLDAMTYGKINKGTGYDDAVAATTNAEAQIKVQQAKDLAIKIDLIDKACFNSLPTGMKREEFIYELLNWPDDVADSGHNAKISERDRQGLMAITVGVKPSDAEISLVRRLKARLIVGKKLLLAAKVNDSRTTKAAVVDVLDKFAVLDKKTIELLQNMEKKLEEEEQKTLKPGDKNITGKSDPIAIFSAKIEIIKSYASKFEEIFNEIKKIDYAAIRKEKQQATITLAKDHFRKHGIERADPDDVVLANPKNKITESIDNSIKSKSAVLTALSNHVNAMVKQLTILDQYHKITDEKFISLWMEMGETMCLYSALTDNVETPRTLFASSKLFEFACLRDEQVRRKLYQQLNEKYPNATKGAGMIAELDKRFVIPDPASEDWNKITPF
jgi:hypothetical protein